MYTRLSLVCLWTLAVSCGIALVASPAATAYELKNVLVTMLPGDDIVVDLSDDPLDTHATGVRVHNPLSNPSGTVRVRWLDGPPAAPGDTVVGGYRLLDLTLEITTDLPLGDTIQVQRRMEFDAGQPIPSGMDAATPQLFGLRERSLRILRRQPGPFSFSWGIPQPAIIHTDRADVRRIYGPADFVLGHYGVDLDNDYVWAVVDFPGTFAVGGVPEPAMAALLLGGAIPLVLLLRRTRKC